MAAVSPPSSSSLPPSSSSSSSSPPPPPPAAASKLASSSAIGNGTVETCASHSSRQQRACQAPLEESSAPTRASVAACSEGEEADASPPSSPSSWSSSSSSSSSTAEAATGGASSPAAPTRTLTTGSKSPTSAGKNRSAAFLPRAETADQRRRAREAVRAAFPALAARESAGAREAPMIEGRCGSRRCGTSWKRSAWKEFLFFQS